MRISIVIWRISRTLRRCFAKSIICIMILLTPFAEFLLQLALGVGSRIVFLSSVVRKNMMANVSPRTDTSADGDIDDKTPVVIFLTSTLAAISICPGF